MRRLQTMYIDIFYKRKLISLSRLCPVIFLFLSSPVFFPFIHATEISSRTYCPYTYIHYEGEIGYCKKASLILSVFPLASVSFLLLLTILEFYVVHLLAIVLINIRIEQNLLIVWKCVSPCAYIKNKILSGKLKLYGHCLCHFEKKKKKKKKDGYCVGKQQVFNVQNLMIYCSCMT